MLTRSTHVGQVETADRAGQQQPVNDISEAALEIPGRSTGVKGRRRRCGGARWEKGMATVMSF